MAAEQRLRSNGNVGIGTTSPSNTLTVVSSACFSHGAGVATLACGSTAGNTYAKANNTSNYDVSENYVTNDPTLVSGEIVALNPVHPQTIMRASSGALPFGLNSTARGLLLGGADGTVTSSSVCAVGLSGRIPTRSLLRAGRSTSAITSSSPQRSAWQRRQETASQGSATRSRTGTHLRETIRFNSSSRRRPRPDCALMPSKSSPPRLNHSADCCVRLIHGHLLAQPLRPHHDLARR
jgi:hypothetical protein